MWYSEVSVFEGLPVQESLCMSTAVGNAYTGSNVSVTWWSLSVWRLASSGKYMYEYCCGGIHTLGNML